MPSARLILNTPRYNTVVGHNVVYAAVGAIILSVALGESYSAWTQLLPIPDWLAIVVLNGAFAVGGLFTVRGLGTSLYQTNFSKIYLLPGAAIVLGAMLLSLVFPSNSAPRGEDLFFLMCSVSIIPLVEEVVFRGVVLTGFRKLVPAFWATYFSAIVFAAAHTMPTWHRVIQMETGFPLGPLLLGLICGVMTVRTKSLIPAVAFHCACNSTVLIFSRMSVDWLDRLSFLYLTGGPN